MQIRRAIEKDIPKVSELLSQVLEIHASIRPDIFISGTTKYTKDELLAIFADDKRPVYVAANEADEVLGYAFCILKEQPFSTNMVPFTSMFIDDLCVDASARGMHLGQQLFEFVKSEARRLGCYEVSLNVWEGNDSARHFYEKMGMGVKETQMEYVLDRDEKSPVQAEEKHSEQAVPECLEIYVDGSYNKVTQEFSYGMVVLTPEGEETYCEKYMDPDLATMHNVAGEIMGARTAMEYAVKRGIPKICLYYDYEGIAKWCLGEWKTNKDGTKAYKAYYDSIKEKLNVEFKKVKGHSNNHYNDLADALAKQALGIR